MAISILTGTGYGFAGSSAVAPVVRPASTTEAVAAGGVPAPYTFGAFTDPDGEIASYTATIKNITGSTSIGSGTGLGPLTFAGYADADSFFVTCDAKNAAGDILATGVHGVNIATPGTAGLVTIFDLDYTNLDVSTLTPGVSTQVFKGAVQYGPAIKVAQQSGSTATVTTGAAGVTIAGGGAAGSMNFGADISSYIDFTTLPGFPLILDFVLTNVTGWTGTNDGYQSGFCDSSSNFSAAIQERSLRMDWTTGGKQARKGSRNNTSALWVSSEAIPVGSVVLTLVMVGLNQNYAFYTLGSTPPTQAEVLAMTGGWLFGGSTLTGTTPPFPSTIYANTRIVFRAGVTLTRIQGRRVG